MIAVPSGASGRSTVQRSTRNAPPSSHAKRTRPSPGHGGPPGGVATVFHSPTKRSSALSIDSAVGWFIASAPPAPAGRFGRRPVVSSLSHTPIRPPPGARTRVRPAARRCARVRRSAGAARGEGGAAVLGAEGRLSRAGRRGAGGGRGRGDGRGPRRRRPVTGGGGTAG